MMGKAIDTVCCTGLGHTFGSGFLSSNAKGEMTNKIFNAHNVKINQFLKSIIMGELKKFFFWASSQEKYSNILNDVLNNIPHVNKNKTYITMLYPSMQGGEITKRSRVFQKEGRQVVKRQGRAKWIGMNEHTATFLSRIHLEYPKCILLHKLDGYILIHPLFMYCP